ncbi:MAG: yjeB [Geminicoccaceae bacterium]|nr:yjeB [Geminicoccaceae bacterium]
MRVIRLSKLADYGIVIMTSLARQPGRHHNAPEVAAQSHIPQPMASKILKALARAGLLTSHRGAKGGYGLARPAEAISVARWTISAWRRCRR